MITLKQIFFEPNDFTGKIIDPIKFDKGINFIIGDRSEEDKVTGEKMNSVGKSLLLEMIDFCFLSDLEGSRINKIPLMVMAGNIYICLTFEVDNGREINSYTIKRIKDDSKPILINEKDFNISEAKNYLEHLFFNGVENRPSLRAMLSLFIRNERTIYDDIVKTNPGARIFSDLIKPHFYLFGFDISNISKIKDYFKKIEDNKKIITSINKDFKEFGVSVKDVRSYINELTDNIEKLTFAIKNLEPSEGIAQKNVDLNQLQSELDSIMAQRTGKEYLIDRIKRMPKYETINTDEVKVLYNQFQLGLGDLVKKSLDEVLAFKKQIDVFQNDLMTKKLISLQKDLTKLDETRDILDKKIAIIYKSYKIDEKIEGLSEAIKMQKEKSDLLEKYKSKYEILEDKGLINKKIDREIVDLKSKIDEEILFKLKDVLSSFEDDLKIMHQYVARNKECHFKIETKEGKEYAKIDFRVNLDGGSGVNRIRTLIYDSLLMLNKYTSERHFGFLIHDNIFASAGRDDFVRSLNYLNEQQMTGKKFQYILTINKDEFDSVINQFNFEYIKKVRAIFTRDSQFLKVSYKEI